jgi:hypothetical protein
MDGWAAEAQAMPASERTKMVQAAQQMFPGVKWDTDANGNINSFEFAGQVDGPTQWSNNESGPFFDQQDQNAINEARQQIVSPQKTSSGDDNGYWDGDDGDDTTFSAPSGNGSVTEPSPYIPDGTVVQGVGNNPGLYISNGDGTVSPW